MAASPRDTWTSAVWWLLVVVDVLAVAVFAVAAAIDPYHVLEGEGVEVHNFQGLLPLAIVVTLRSMTLAAERRLLPVARGTPVLAGRLASLIGSYYTGRWLYDHAYGRWYEMVLGGTVGYALVGVLGIGLAALIYNLSRIRLTEPPQELPPGDAPTSNTAATADRTPDAPRPVTVVPPTAASAAATATQRRQLTRDSLFSLVGVFLGVTGLVIGVTNLVRLGLAVLVGAVAVAGIALLVREKDDSPGPS